MDDNFHGSASKLHVKEDKLHGLDEKIHGSDESICVMASYVEKSSCFSYVSKKIQEFLEFLSRFSV